MRFQPRRCLPVRIIHAAISVASLVAVQFADAATPPVLDQQHAAVRAVMAVQADVTPGLMSSSAVLGTAVGADEASQPVLVVYVNPEDGGAAAAMRSVPVRLRGIATRVELTEPFRAFKGPPGGGGGSVETTTSVSDHRVKQAAPIKLGASGGWGLDLANGYCCGGTLGALVQIGGTKYVLSNYHVLEADIVSGGNDTVAANGQDVIQPALIDVSCSAGNAQVVARLAKRSSLPASNVDCAIAEVVPGMVREDGAILGIGTLSSAIASARLNQAVKKSGRTTGFTRSKVSGLNATIRVSYENECAGSAAFTKTFTGQIVFANKGSKFLAGGDSGSVAVEDVATNPRAVGLLFAGSSTSAIANPIGEVLGFLGGATMVGQ